MKWIRLSEKMRGLRIKQRFLIVLGFVTLFGIIADISLFEIAKTADFQKMVRLHGEYLERIEYIAGELSKTKKKSSTYSKELEDIFDRQSDIHSEKGINQLLSELETITGSFNNIVNPMEKCILKMAGFGELFEIAGYHHDDIFMMKKTVREFNGYKGQDIISPEELADKLVSNVEMIREDDEIFSKLVNSMSHSIKIMTISVITINLVIILISGFFIYKGLMIQVNEARSNIHTSSQELQTNSQQQLQAASRQTIAMGEVSSVMQELVATSGQVFELSSNASSLVKDTDAAVHEGHMALDQTIEGINRIKEKVEVSVSDMLSLGEKSQQIGIVLDVINELSQQVTVLSYNATIEAAGAGEMGKRFMAVADRIIKLAERSVESAKEIKSIIDDVQTDSNKTIMSTEDSIKAVEYGVARSVEVKQSLEKISEFSRQVLDSVDEINMSTNQQKTGVGQAASEIEDITISVRETEDSSKQVLETANQLLDMAGVLEKI